MKKPTTLQRKFTSSLFTLLIITVGSTAQKLPNKQETSELAPANINIDGKATEWPGHLQAYNHATDIYYTIANDDKNLYLVAEATEQSVINKILNGGITLSIHQYGEKKDKNTVNITYPVIEGIPPFFSNLAGRNWQDMSASAVEALVKTYNNRLDISCKWIGINGIPGIDDKLSVYNTDGIKVIGQFDTKRAYVCEFALPLKYLKMAGGRPFKFSYHIVLNGSKMEPMTTMPNDGKQYPPMVAKLAARQAINTMDTDFWGNYTLAEK